MPPGPGDTRPPTAATPLGGVRADFVANLGRRLSELRQHWATVEQNPGVPRFRDEVRRRVHALATRSRLLEFKVMADKLDEAERRMERAAAVGSLAADDIGWFHDLFVSLPSLAWNDVPGDEQRMAVPSYFPETSHEPVARSNQPLAVLVVGAPNLAEALSEPGGSGPEIECERTEIASSALDLARALAPDVVVIDMDLPGAREFVTALASDPLTEPVPVLAVGSWTAADQGAGALSLGISRALPKPVSPDRLREAVYASAAAGARVVLPLEPLGELTIEQLADRLSTQLRLGLVESLSRESRTVRVPFGEGTELIAAVLGTVARARETVTIRSHGTVRFASADAAGAVPIAPWLDVSRAATPSRRGTDRDAHTQSAVHLQGRRMIVADDDPAVTWFLSGLLRRAGAMVYEAHDGRKALEMAWRFSPDLIVSDVLMPEVDGLALCRQVKRDVALHDVPVILLSWKEDLLQRVRELGADADGYLKKESSGPAILQRVHELLRPRLRVEGRLREGGEVRGRLDGLAARTLLQLVAMTLPDSRLSVRDASYLYEIELRDGAPRNATRTAQDGAFQRGPQVIISLLGVFSGRFSVTPSEAPVRDTIHSDLVSLLNPAIARARGAQYLLSGARLLQVSSVRLSADALAIQSVPEPAASLLLALQDGAAPWELVDRQRASPTLLEQLLDDSARRGAIDAILNAEGVDLLEPEMQRHLEMLKIDEASMRPPRHASSAPTIPAPAPAPSDKARAAVPPPAPVGTTATMDFALDDAPVIEAAEGADLDDAEAEALARNSGAPASLTEAVIREVLDAGGVRLPSPAPPAPMLDARDLKPRSVPSHPKLSLPPDAIVPAAEGLAADASLQHEEPSIPAAPTIPPAPRVPSRLPTAAADHKPVLKLEPAQDDATEHALPRALPNEPALKREPLAPQTPEPEQGTVLPKRSAAPTLLVLGVFASVLVALGVYLSGNQPTAPVPVPSASVPRVAPPSGMPPSPVSASAYPQPSASTPVTARSIAPSESAIAPPSASAEQTASPPEEGTEDDFPLPRGSTVHKGLGLLEVQTGRGNAVVYIDGTAVAEGFHYQNAFGPGRHVVRVRAGGKEVERLVTLRAGRHTRISLEQEWTR